MQQAIVSSIFSDGREALKRAPWGLFAVVGTLLVIGMTFIYSATNDFSETEHASRSASYAIKQAGFAGLGLFAAFCVSLFDYRKLAPLFPLVYLAGIGLLIACMIFGREINGAKSWIVIGGFGIQVSEYCKLCYVITLAGLLRYRKSVDSVRSMALILGATTVMLAMIVTQPDFGTAMVFVPVFFAVMWTCGARLKILAPMLLSGAALLPAMYFLGLFKDHQVRRIDTWIASVFGGDMDLTGDGYHISMSMNAIGSGGTTGKGLFEGTLSQLDYLPERHTDFIFSVIGEEFGFVGALFVILLYMALIGCCLMTALRTREPFGRTLCVGIATMFCAQFLINVGMTCGLMPVTGIPLFFVSYGGSSLMSAFLAVGLVASVRMHPGRVLTKSAIGGGLITAERGRLDG